MVLELTKEQADRLWLLKKKTSIEKKNQCRITDEKKEGIQIMLDDGYSTYHISKALNCSREVVRKVRDGWYD